MKQFEREIKQIAEVLKNESVFFTAVHHNPDGDALGSSLAAASVLRRMGKEVYCYSVDEVPGYLKFIDGVKTIKHELPPPDMKFDCAVMIECSTPDRGGDLRDVFARTKTVLNIDHHQTYESYGDVNLVDYKSASTAEIIYKILMALGQGITADEATSLYAGIATDTGRYQFGNVNPETFETSAALLRLGAKTVMVNELVYATKELPSLHLLGLALNTLKVIHNGKTSVMTLTQTAFNKAHARNEHTDGIVNHGLMVPGIETTVLFREFSSKITVNFRSKGRYDVSKVANYFGGGGHKNAAGCKSSTRTLEEMYTLVMEQMEKLYADGNSAGR